MESACDRQRDLYRATGSHSGSACHKKESDVTELGGLWPSAACHATSARPSPYLGMECQPWDLRRYPFIVCDILHTVHDHELARGHDL